MNKSENPPIIWILAGETSGDELGAKLIKALRHFNPDLQFLGVGGPRMQEQEMKILFPMQDLAVMGLVEVLPKIWTLSKRLNQAVKHIETIHPDIIVTIDSPGFSLRLLKKVQSLSIPRVHYVAPQVWAWHENRVKKFPGLWEKLLCLFPFEENFFLKHGIKAQFVGNPIIETEIHHANADDFRSEHHIDPLQPILLLMPGSRRSELPKLMPVFKKTLILLKQTKPELIAVLPTSPLARHYVERIIEDWPVKPLVIHEKKDKYNAYAAAQIALTKSGTTTLELALAHIPMIVTYRVHPITAMIARHMIQVPFVAMVNLLAQKEVVPELLQENCNPVKLAEKVIEFLDDKNMVQKQKKAFIQILNALKAPHHQPPSYEAAKEILELMNKNE